jgi:hypothetical protein
VLDDSNNLILFSDAAIPMPSTLGIDLRSFLQQQLHNLIISFRRRSLQSISTLSTLGIDIGPFLEQ